MITPTDARSGKSHRDENFPVASRLIRAAHRGPVLAFYRFVRAADDVADHPTLKRAEKRALLDRLAAALEGQGPSDPEAEPLRQALAERRLSSRHALDLLAAFRMDVEKSRYADWGELMHYCSLSAMPVGRFVLDVHGEAQGTWAASDPLCAALQVINHLQDCGEDFRNLDRVYLPADVLAAHGTIVEALAAPRGSPALRGAIADLAGRCETLLGASAPLAALVVDRRLSHEIAVIQRAAVTLTGLLKTRDPLSEKVHLGKLGFLMSAGIAVAGNLLRGRAVGREKRAA